MFCRAYLDPPDEGDKDPLLPPRMAPPCQQAKVVMNYLKLYENEFTVMNWPGNSPDLNGRPLLQEPRRLYA